MLASLEAEGLISRGADFADGRCQSVGLTTDCAEKVAGIIASATVEMSNLSPDLPAVAQALLQLVSLF